MNDLTFYHGFVLPFLIGTGVLFAVILYKYVRWFSRLPGKDLRKVRRGIFSVETLRGIGEVISECLLHRRIWRVNPLLGYMHTSFALGWALLIVLGWIETIAYLGWRWVPLQGHIFFKFFTTGLDHGPRWGVDFDAVMDLLLLYVLSGLVLALFKRVRSRALGMKRTTRHTIGDRAAMTALWFIFPMRLLAESLTSGIHGSGGFLTGNLGAALVEIAPKTLLPGLEMVSWWGYSAALAVFFIAMPFSRYMHIFTEVPLIFLRRWGVRSGLRESSFDRFQLEACSRCGICIDPCQLQRDGGFGSVQAAYFIRDRRYGRLTREVADNCLMCGRCQGRCPVGIELDTLRLNSRRTLSGAPSDGRFDYARGIVSGRENEVENGAGADVAAARNASKNGTTEAPKIGYFAGCMTLLTPKILRAMDTIFAAAGEDVWHADRDGGVCCGRPLKLSGDTDAARDMMQLNEELFRRHGITVLVTSCPICLRVFREDYSLEGIEVLHHSEYIARLMASGRLVLGPGEDLSHSDRIPQPRAGEECQQFSLALVCNNSGAVPTDSDKDGDSQCQPVRLAPEVSGLPKNGGQNGKFAERSTFTYHDPCELGRGCGIYDAPRDVLRAVGRLVEPAETRENGLCCGSSIANTVVDNGAQVAMARAVGRDFEATGADVLVTACPLCKKALARGTTLPVEDLAEVVACRIASRQAAL